MPGKINQAACVKEIRSAILRLTSDRERCRRLGERARERLEEKFTWSKVARRYNAVYEAHAR
jgi:glycosyltransferase involved in cell wall biosynthesis